MNLIWFLTVSTILSITLGEFGQFPFGMTSPSISLTDILLSLTLLLLFIWQIEVKKKFQMPKIFKVLMLFWIVAFGSLFWSGNLTGGLYLIRFIFYSLSFLLGYQLIKSKRIEMDKLIMVVVLTSSLLSILGCVQLLVLPDLEQLKLLGFDPHKERLVSTFLDPNFAGVIINLGLILSIYLWIKKKTFLLFLGIVTNSFALILTFSRSAYLMLLIALLLLGFLKFRKIMPLLLMTVIILFIAVPRFSERIEGILSLDKSASERIDSWNKGFIIFQKNPILGVGFNNLNAASEKYQLVKIFSKDGGHSSSGIDSSFLTVLSTTGVAGFLPYISFWILILINLLKRYQIKNQGDLPLFFLAIIASILVSSQFINSLFYPPNMLITYLLIGSFYGKTY